MSAPAPRLILIAFDAADEGLIREWAAAGHLPAFRRLLDETAYGTCESPRGLFVGAVWPTLATAVSPATHARYCFRQLVPGTYEVRRIHARDIQARPFWQTLSDHGKRVAIVDLPKTSPVTGLNGIQIVDWALHDPDYKQIATWPESLAAEILARYGADPVGNCNPYAADGDGLAALRTSLLERIERKTTLILDLLARERWDFFAAAFGDSHCAGHQFWHVHDVAHAKHDPALRARFGDPVRDVYQALDAALARILAALPSDTDVLVIASHGFRPHYDLNFLLDEMLWRIEQPWPGTRGRSGRLAAGVAARLPERVRRALLRTYDPTVPPRVPPAATRRWFAIPNNDSVGGVRLNLVGREPSGLVPPDAADATCDRIATALRAFVDAETGAPVVTAVARTRDLYRGPNAHHLPDLLVEWNYERPVRSVRAPTAGSVAGVEPYTRTGDHRREGLFFLRGSGVRPGPIDRRVSVMDIGPTIAARLGVTLDGVEGGSFADACAEREGAA